MRHVFSSGILPVMLALSAVPGSACESVVLTGPQPVFLSGKTESKEGASACFILSVPQERSIVLKIVPPSTSDLGFSVVGIVDNQYEYSFTSKKIEYEVQVNHTFRGRSSVPFRVRAMLGRESAGHGLSTSARQDGTKSSAVEEAYGSSPEVIARKIYSQRSGDVRKALSVELTKVDNSVSPTWIYGGYYPDAPKYSIKTIAINDTQAEIRVEVRMTDVKLVRSLNFAKENGTWLVDWVGLDLPEGKRVPARRP